MNMIYLLLISLALAGCATIHPSHFSTVSILCEKVEKPFDDVRYRCNGKKIISIIVKF